MPRKPPVNATKLIPPGVGIDAIRHAIFPLLNYVRCESPAFVRRALIRAINKDLRQVAQSAELVPGVETISLGKGRGRSRDNLRAIVNADQINLAANEAASQLKKARYFFEQAEAVGDEIKPILFYYGATYFLDFVCLNLVRRQPAGSPGHGLSLTVDSKGWDFDRNWARTKCRTRVGRTGDFPFFIDALTVSGYVSLFSAFRFHQDRKTDPKIVRINPAPLFCSQKASLDLLCNFDVKRYLKDSPGLDEWLIGTSKEMVVRLTYLLLDLMVVFIAASLARYCTPAWNKIIEANHSPLYNDIRAAYRGVSSGFALYFEDEYPFQYSYETRIPPYSGVSAGPMTALG